MATIEHHTREIINDLQINHRMKPHFLTFLLLVVFFSLITQGCVLKSLNPTLKTKIEQTDIDKAEQDICLKSNNDRITAKKCAIYTLHELTEILNNAAEIERIFSYTLWGIGTVAGIEAAVGINQNTGKNLLKELGIATASILGLSNIIKTDEQKNIIKSAQKNLLCALKSSDAIVASFEQNIVKSGEFATVSYYGNDDKNKGALTEAGKYDPSKHTITRGTLKPISIPDTEFKKLYGETHGFILPKDATELNNLMLKERNEKNATLYKAESNSATKAVNDLRFELTNSYATVGTVLSEEVIYTRTIVTQMLSELTPNLKDLATQQQDAVLKQIGFLVSKATQAKRVLAQISPDNPEQLVPNSLNDNLVTIAPVLNVLRSACVTPEVQRIIENQ